MNQSDIPQPVSESELQKAVEILAKFEPGYLPFPLFMAIARLVVFAIIEVVPVRRRKDGKVEILLIQREPTDELWPSMWHNPGVVVLASDAPGSFKDPFDRILTKELGMTGDMPEPVFIGLSFHKTRRGTDATMIHYVELSDDFIPETGQFFASDALPENIVDSNQALISRAASVFANS